MIIPKQHYSDLLDLPKKLVGEAFDVAHSVAEKVTGGLSADGVSLVINSGEEAGQRVPHLYIQVFPRFSGEETAGAPAGAIFKPMEIDESELKDYQEKIASASHSKAEAKVRKAEERVQDGKDEEEQEKKKDKDETNDSNAGFSADEVEFR